MSLLLAASVVLVFCGCGPKTQGPTPASTEDMGVVVAGLTADISALEFINRLQLDAKQTASLVAALQDAAGTPEDGGRAARQSLLGQLAALLQQKRYALMKDEPVSAELAGQIADLQRQIAELDIPDPQLETALAKKLRDILTEAQIKVAVGGLETTIQAGEMLDGFRMLSDEVFNNEVGPFCEELASGADDFTPESIEAVLREARSLSDEEYRQSRGALVKQIEPLFAPVGETADWLITRAFLAPRVLELLSEQGAGSPSPSPKGPSK